MLNSNNLHFLNFLLRNISSKTQNVNTRYIIMIFLSGNAVVVVVIVSMGILITVLAVGVVRLRNVASREQTEDGEVEMAWDGAPNITINPLEVIHSMTLI